MPAPKIIGKATAAAVESAPAAVAPPTPISAAIAADPVAIAPPTPISAAIAAADPVAIAPLTPILAAIAADPVAIDHIVVRPPILRLKIAVRTSYLKDFFEISITTSNYSVTFL